jgi:hypothetical protein
LAPFFTEIDDNKEYIEKEDEFEKVFSDEFEGNPEWNKLTDDEKR